MSRHKIFVSICAAVVLGSSSVQAAGTDMTGINDRPIVKEAYIYGYPMVDNYRVMYSYFVDQSNPEYKGGWNEVHNTARVYTPEDKTIQTPNSDTPYSMVGADLRTEPLVITLPSVEQNRYYSVQCVDLYTHNFAYLGSRTTGNNGGHFLLAGPSWKGKAPSGITSVIQSETELCLLVYRTQLFGAEDLENVKKIQAGYKIQPLSAFLNKKSPRLASPINFVKPLTPSEQRSSLELFNILNFVLQFCPTHPSEKELMARFAKIGVGRGKNINLSALSPEMRAVYGMGIADAWQAFNDLKQQIDQHKVSSGDFFGTRDYLKNNYLYRMSAAVLGIYGNSKDEAVYHGYTIDSDGKPLDGSQSYVLRFAPGQLPPVNAFWSLTMYGMPESLLVPNPLNRYLINSPMVRSLQKTPDGSLNIYIQAQSPGTDRESNWLPAPHGPFIVVLRLYWPKPEVLNNQWSAPPLQVVLLSPAPVKNETTKNKPGKKK